MAEKDTEQEQDAGEDFAVFLVKTNKGRTHKKLSTGLAEIVKQVKATGKKGELILKVAVKPLKNTDQLEVTEVVQVKAPEAEARASIFFATDDGKLSREDPANQTLTGFEAVAKEAGL